MLECCRCGAKIEGTPHPAPHGVMLCSEKCYREWKAIIEGVLELKQLIHYQPEGEKEKRQQKSLENTAKWISTFEKQKEIEYIK